MKKLRIKCIIWYGKVLSMVVTLLGVVSCGSFRPFKRLPALMYGVPYVVTDEDSISAKRQGEETDSVARTREAGETRSRKTAKSISLMYGPPPARYVEKVPETK